MHNTPTPLYTVADTQTQTDSLSRDNHSPGTIQQSINALPTALAHELQHTQSKLAEVGLRLQV
jgi:hypothetical protein